MDVQLEPPDARREPIARAGLGALMAIASVDHAPNERALRMIESVRDRLMKVDVALEDVRPLLPADVAMAVPETEWRERIIRGMTLLAMLEGPPTSGELNLLDAVAEAFGVAAAPVDTFRKLLEEKFMMVRLDIIRRTFIKPAIGAYVKIEGARGAVDIAKSLLRQEDAELAAKYRALDDYPEGTFGRAYADFIGINRFQYPGEVGGLPPPAMRHDICHTLGGYGTIASEECAVLAFQAGFQKEDPFFVMLFTIAQFELGVRVSPLLPGAKLGIDPDLIVAGLEHGRSVNTDLIGDVSWDPWDHFEKPIDEVRASLGVRPRGREPQYLQYDHDGNIVVTM
ncbi:MAG: TerB family tellurite resistance protein [Myxococcota bacterium]